MLLCILDGEGLMSRRKKLNLSEVFDLLEACYGSRFYIRWSMIEKEKPIKELDVVFAYKYIDEKPIVFRLFIHPHVTSDELFETISCAVREEVKYVF